MNYSFRAIALGVALLSLPFLGVACKQTAQATPVTITMWSVYDDQDALRSVVSSFNASHPNIQVILRKIRYEEYERELLNAWAEDRGPDIFSIHNTWVSKYQPKIAPMPATITLPFQYTSGTLKKETVTEMRTFSSITPAEIRDQYIDVVAEDVIRKDAQSKEQVLGLPLSMDTLVMYYNKDILNQAGIATPPTDWQTLLNDVAKISKVDESGNLVVSGAALGTAANIPRASDILATLMMQNGAKMTDGNGYPTFQGGGTVAGGLTSSPGIGALVFYTDFANPAKQAYSWNSTMPNALEAFGQGRVAFYFGYAYDMPRLRAQAPQLRWAIAPIPQVNAESNRVNFANYWIETVAKKSAHQPEAWDFIQYAALKENVTGYLQAAKLPTALRGLIDSQKEDPLLEPFSEELLTAKSWYRGVDVGAAEQAIADMIEGTPAALASSNKAALGSLVSTTVGRIGQTIK